MGQISLNIPQTGQPNATQDPLVASNFSTIQTWANGNVDGTNLSAAAAQSAAVNQGGQTVKGATNIAASESRTNVAYGTLTTPDQVTGIVLPTNGLIRVWYQATWQESVAGAARAAIFIGSNQLQAAGNAAPNAQQAATGSSFAPYNRVLFTNPAGLWNLSIAAGNYGGDVTTGQIVGVGTTSGTSIYGELGGTPVSYAVSGTVGGPCDIFAAAGTYTVAIMFKSSSGSVTASNRKLWVQALSFS